MSKSVLDMRTDEAFRKLMIDALTNGLGDKKQLLIDILEYVVDQKLHLFESVEFEGTMYDEEDQMVDLILPCVRRIFAEVFFNPPTLFKETGYNNGHRYKLFTMFFNADEFIDYLIDMFIKSKDCLQHFEHIDRTAETLTLIVDNYVASLVQKVLDIEDHEQAIEGILKQQKREETINQIFEENQNGLL